MGNSSANKANNHGKSFLNNSVKEEKKKGATNMTLLEEKKVNLTSISKKGEPLGRIEEE